METYSTILFSLFLLAFTLGLTKLLSKNQKKLPPGPNGLPIIGNLLTIGNKPHQSLTKLAKKHGPLMTVKLGSNTIVVASSRDTAREILQKNDQAFLGRYIPDAITAEKNHDLSIAWLPGGPKWRSLRKLCNSQIFTVQRLDALQGLRHQMMEKMVARLVDASEAGGEGVKIGELVFATTLNLLSNTMFSADVVDQELKEVISGIMELGGKPNIAEYLPWLKAFDLQHIKRDIKVYFDRLHELVDDVIDRRLKRRASVGSPRFDDFLDVLLDNIQEHGSEPLILEDVTILIAHLIIGGTDTTATTIEWTMTELLKNPSVMAKAKQELAATIGPNQTVKEKDIPELPYLQAVLKETMRLHPTAPLLLPHCTEAAVEIFGYTIPKHTQVSVNTWAISRDPAYWDKPEEYLPERFLGSEVDFRSKEFSFTPFGAGRRICPGLDLAVRMLNLLLGSLIHHFDWKLPDGMASEDIDMEENFGITLQKSIPLIIIPKVVASIS